ncbi:unnamed protein product [Ranitomeya imitator]|uniref:Secretogranin-3 n=1 Tax=Ranitomeya imitator TaxID=111125 RepID=A0ABN9M8Q5_9NEOB|nr:unnamed protein product [Ranitomeya imitator]
MSIAAASLFGRWRAVTQTALQRPTIPKSPAVTSPLCCALRLAGAHQSVQEADGEGPDQTPESDKTDEESDSTKEAAANMEKEYEKLKDSTKPEEPKEIADSKKHNGKAETYLEAIRKNIEWMKTHNKQENKEDRDISKLRDLIDQQADTYVEKGILDQEEANVIKRIYSSL